MVNWIILGVLIYVLFVFFKVKRFQHRVYAILIILFVIFFYTTGSKIIAENNIDIKTFDGIMKANKLYFNWLVHSFKNVKVVVGNTIKMNWAGNSTVK